MDDDGDPRLCDFGQSKFIDDKDYDIPFMASARYLAPELSDIDLDLDFDSEAPGNLTKATDVFAFSMVALEVSGLPCFLFWDVLWDPLQMVVRVDLVIMPTCCLVTHIFVFCTDSVRKASLLLPPPKYYCHRTNTGRHTTRASKELANDLHRPYVGSPS
jgi:serine/threonine protein kinase